MLITMNESENETFGEWLQKQLDDRDWTQADLSRRIGMSRAGVNALIRDINRPRPENCLEIAKALSVSPVEVFRAARMMPTQPETDPELDEAKYLLDTLPKGDVSQILAIIRMYAARGANAATPAPKRRRPPHSGAA